jgi:hypothetical protein
MTFHERDSSKKEKEAGYASLLNAAVFDAQLIGSKGNTGGHDAP